MRIVQKKENAMSYILTRSGRQFNFANPHPSMVVLDDVAHALANLNRFTGHTGYAYSVAQHSVAVSRFLELTGEPLIIQLAGLLHDAHEAYFGDISAPMKEFLKFRTIGNIVAGTVFEALGIKDAGLDGVAGSPGAQALGLTADTLDAIIRSGIEKAMALSIGRLEDRIQSVVAEAFGLSLALMKDPRVKLADLTALAVEADVLMPPDTEDWPVLAPVTPVMKAVMPRPYRLTPEQAKCLFLNRYRQLTSQLYEDEAAFEAAGLAYRDAMMQMKRLDPHAIIEV
jgi:hypothetical protein